MNNKNKFMMAAHNLEVKWTGQRPAYKNEWPDAIKKEPTMFDYILFAALSLLGIALLIKLVWNY